MGNKICNILVIGGAAGIGKEIVLDFAQKGNKVAVADINKAAVDQLIRDHQLEPNVFSFEVDVSSWDSVKSMAKKVKETLGEIHVLVCSAGITKSLKLQDVEWSLWKKTMEINLHGLFYSIKSVAPYMMEQKRGSIIIIGSGSAITGSGGGVQYYASKGGAFGLMRSLVPELGQYGININVIAPRVIESQMLDVLYPTEQAKDELKKRIPIGRLGKPSDISSMVEYLSKEESNYIHGQILVLDGGRTYQGKKEIVVCNQHF
ncbi:SDR family NAD(P)-dependent oxidoreductase [Alkalihalobacillus sp. BA299]|uniref:SDR family NAD(P)-dependent oxidoreductase n=1 Tax=Alkalihalobacillus sp. BA299 TaxID=2815938 RepID=UPI001ADB4431|nr:SDR family oxidoreductase [Alkalihalobacillus sp. BA299]